MSLIARTRNCDSLTLPVAMSPRRYNFLRLRPRGVSVRNFPQASSRNMADECEILDAVLVTVDLAIYSTYSTDGSPVDEWEDTLQSFRRICKLPWLAEKEIVLIFLNLDKLSKKRLSVHVPSHKNRDRHPWTANEIVQTFLSLDEDDSREIHVIFADNEVRAKNLECFERAMERILSKKATAAQNL